MGTVISFLEKYFVPVAAKFGAQRHLVAIRDGFVAIMPLLTVGALAILINSFPVTAYQEFMTKIFGESWKSFGGNVWTGSYAIMSLVVVFSVSYSLAKSYEADGMAAGLVAFGALLMLYSGSEKDWAIPFSYLGAQGLFVALFAAIVSTEIFVKLMGNSKLVIKMPEAVPPAVAKSFAALIPSMVVIMLFALIQCILTAAGVTNLHEAIFKAIQAPISGFADQLGSAIFVAFLIHILWFFGLHGSNIILPLTNAVYLPNINNNIAAFQAGQSIPHIVTPPFFDAFVWMGGAGTTFSLVAALMIAAKRRDMKDITKLTAAPALFNINEPMLFGLPICLNPIYLVPFVLTPILLTITSYLAIAAGIVPRTIAMMPWTTPPVIGGFLVTGSVMGGLLALINIVIGILIYLPFVILAQSQGDKKDRDQVSKAETTSVKG
ncbi:PTS cellobiose transporter subunit IIC [Acetonema longum]|uniref:Permease IIC component n=1 Tax=Acetonema longum DSM 6540 TaxID=1009370 RepID=F7NMV3_9FIRM|nr:PTS cellobiose transporter subunit IIC [Acetonema longum]EGO62647.1 PTS system, lactose/cellobiose family IIC subunit [Acetonema longum DSM 6540]